MKAPARLGLYGLVLVVVFAVAGFTANTVVPEDTVQAWAEEAAENDHTEGHDMMGEEGHADHDDASSSSPGLGLAQDGYQLTDVTAPAAVGGQGELSLTVSGREGSPVTEFELEHEKELHLIVVRSDGQHFRHVHPERDDAGAWSIPWEWAAAGSYRVFADFVPAKTGEGMTLSTSVQVGGEYEPAPAEGPVLETTVDGFTVAVSGDLTAGEASELTMTITRDGEAVTELEPYLGAFGHLVALRDGDLAYLHVHPHGDSPEARETSGTEIVFEATAPTPGRYLLFLDFQVDGDVHTAPLVIDTTTDAITGGGQESHEEGAGHDH